MLLVQLLFMVLFGVICALIANNKGRSVVGWFLIGFLLTWIALIIILVVSNPRKEQERDRRLRRENRRLREQMRKDRMVADQRHRRIQQRIDAHDAVQGLDTDAADHGGELTWDDGYPAADSSARG